MKRQPHPTLDDLDACSPAFDAESPAKTLDYWTARDRWAELGRAIARYRDDAKRLGVPIEALAGAPALIAAFRKLGRELDRRAR